MVYPIPPDDRLGEHATALNTIGICNTMLCVYVNIFEHRAIKKNKMTSFVDKWMDLENIMLCEISQSQKKNGHMFSLICTT